MSPTRRRKSRSNTIIKEKTSKTSVRTSSIQQNNDVMTNPPDNSVDELTFTVLQPVPLEVSEDFQNIPASPRPLMIDQASPRPLMIDQASPRALMIDQASPRALMIDPPRTPFTNKTLTKSLTNTVKHSRSIRNCSTNINAKETSTNNKEININSTSTVYQNMPNIYSQILNEPIVVSVERSTRNSNEENTYNHRTSIPQSSSHHQQVNNTPDGEGNDSFSMNSISSDTYQILSRFPEFRRLVKAYNNEKRKCQMWINDYARLQQQCNQLQENSFPRPPIVALSYLVDLVTIIQQSSGRGDARSDEELARDLGVNPIILMSLKDKSPQQTALNVFNYIYPGYSEKVKLASITNLESLRPALLETILVFAQRVAPGVPYKMQDLREALSNSIRGARYQSRRSNGNIIQAMGLFENGNADRGVSQRDMNQIIHHDNPTGNNDMEIDASM